MFRQITTICLVFACVVLIGSSVEAQKKNASIEGTWVVIALEDGGNKIPADSLKKMNIEISFKGGKLKHKIQGKVRREGSYELDQSVTPAKIDTKSGKVLEKGIFKLKDDQLTICTGVRSQNRPREFKTASGSKSILIVLKRVK